MFMICSLGAGAQVFSVYDINTGDYPIVEARFLYLDSSGRQVLDMEPGDLQITEKGRSARVLDIAPPGRQSGRKLSVVLAFDVSSSMEQQRLGMARSAALKFLRLLPLETSECAVSSFDQLNYLNCDFTHNPERLRQSIRSLRARGGTNYNSGFITPYSGALKIAQQGRFKRVVIFLTDGLGRGDRKKIIRQANRHNITVYPVTVNMATPQILKDIARQTGGRYFGKVNRVSRAKAIYDEIFVHASSLEAGTLTWKSPNACSRKIPTVFQLLGQRYRTRYRLTPDQQVRLEVDPRYVRLRSTASLDAAPTRDAGPSQEAASSGKTFANEDTSAGHAISNRDTSSGKTFSPGNASPGPTLTPVDSSPGQTISKGAASSGKILSKGFLRFNRKNSRSVMLRAVHGGFTIEGLHTGQKTGFTIRPGRNLPFYLEQGAQMRVNIAPDSGRGGSSYGRVAIKNDRCPDAYFYVKGPGRDDGRPLKLVTPNGGEVFTPGMQAPIAWEGLAGEDSVRFYHSGDGGDHWQLIGSSDGLKTSWEVPADTGDENLIRLEQGEAARGQLTVDSLMSPAGRDYKAHNARFVGSGQYMVTMEDDHRLKFWEGGSGAFIRSLPLHRDWIYNISQSPGGGRIVTASDDGQAKIVRLKTGKVEETLYINSWGLNQAVFHPSGRKILTAGDDGAVRVWDAATGKHLYGMLAHQGWVMDVAVSPDGRRIVTCGDDRQIRIWQMGSGRHLKTLSAHRNWVYDVEYSPDGQRILSASKDSTFRLWDGSSGKLLVTNRRHSGKVYQATFSKSGKRILTASRDGTARVWDSSGNKQLAVIEAPGESWFHRAHFAPDGQRIITANSRRRVNVWLSDASKPFRSDVSDGPFRIIAPRPKLKKASMGRSPVGHPVDALIDGFFTNPSEHPIQVQSVEVTGHDRQDFQLVSGFQPFQLPPGESRDLEVSFKPSSIGQRKARIRVITTTDTLYARATGRGIIRDYELPHQRMHLGKLKLGKSNDSAFAVIKNTGQTSLSLKDIHIDGPGRQAFALKEGGDDQKVYPHGNHQVRVVYQAKQRGRSSARLYFKTGQTIHSIDLMGEAVAPVRMVLRGQIFDRQTRQPLKAQVTCADLKSNRTLRKARSSPTGRFVIKLNTGRRYRVAAHKEGYLPAGISLDLTEPTLSDTLTRRIYLSDVEVGSSVTLNNIFFEYNKATLTPASRGEIKQLAGFLRRHDSLYVEIAGHTDSIGTRKGNLQLSRARARAVCDYLTNLGIADQRLIPKGYGEEKPVADNSTPKGRRKNRRVVFTIIRQPEH